MSPKCYIHNTVEATGKCYKCGNDICDKCRVDYHGKDLCVECGKPLLNSLESMLYNNPDILQEKKKFTDYSETGELIKN